MSERSFLRLERLTRRFAGTAAVHELSLDVSEHEIVTVLGPSGCGKTTTLRMIAGFEHPDAGRVMLEGRDVTGRSPQQRGFGMVFQHYALFPHMSVGDNVGFGLATAGLAGPEVAERVARALRLVQLPNTEKRAINSLSGGQQQRVALARALAPEPKVLLLDEPLSNLDAALREETRRELRGLVKAIGITTVYVTHDQEEAFDLSDRIAVMREGRLEQVGPPEKLYHSPASAFVATFLGRAGSLDAVAGLPAEAGGLHCHLAGGVEWLALAPGDPPITPGSSVQLFARPEALAIVPPETPNVLRGTVSDRRFAGSTYIYRVRVEGGELEVQADNDVARPGSGVALAPRSAPTGLFAFARQDANA